MSAFVALEVRKHGNGWREISGMNYVERAWIPFLGHDKALPIAKAILLQWIHSMSTTSEYAHFRYITDSGHVLFEGLFPDYAEFSVENLKYPFQ